MSVEGGCERGAFARDQWIHEVLIENLRDVPENRVLHSRAMGA